MDLVARMLASELQSRYSDSFEVDLRCPRFIKFNLFGRVAHATSAKSINNTERALNRYLNYPIWLRGERERYDLFHIIDHSYAHLANYLPPEKTIVTCHDLDAFQSVLDGSSRPARSIVLRAVASHVLKGFGRAAMVSCVSRATRDAIVAANLAAPWKTVVIPNGIDSAMSPNAESEADEVAARLLGPRVPGAIEIVHVGSIEARKRIDLLLRVFAGIRQQNRDARLIRIGGELSAEHAKMTRELGISDRIATMPYVERRVLAAIYRRASILLLPSEAEGFGLPLLEAMACGCPVVASDLPALREVGGDAASYCKVGDIDSWVRTAAEILKSNCGGERESLKRREQLIAQAAPFSWKESASKTAEVYRAVASRSISRSIV